MDINTAPTALANLLPNFKPGDIVKHQDMEEEILLLGSSNDRVWYGSL